MNLLAIILPTTNPQKNLQIEEKLLDIKDDYYVLRFWINEPCIVMGRFQKIEYEVNQEFLLSNNIPVLHRFTGGGTVYHDLGNLNITFCKPRYPALLSSAIVKEGKFITEIIRDAIGIDNVTLTVDDRNGIYHNGKKLLGSAIALKKNKFLYHASLLVNANLQNLQNAINWNPMYPQNDKKFVKSHRSQVINLTQLYPTDIEEIKSNILNGFKHVLNPNQTIFISEEDQLNYFCI